MSQGWAVAVRELWYAVEALRAPRRSRAAIERRALRGIQRLHAFARAEVPYYRDDPAYDVPIETLDDLAKLPRLAKQLVRDGGVERFHAPPRGWFQTDATSGSTGKVLRVRHDAGAYGYHGATLLRRFLAAGCRPWWTIAHVKPFPRPSRWFQRFGVFRRTVVPAGLPEAELKDRILAVRPHVVMAYPVMLRALLRELSAAELATLRRDLRLVLSESELLTDEMRQLFTDRFGVPVRDEYSAYEVLTVAHQCRHGSMHVDEDRVHLELLDEAGQPVPDGADGAVVVTHFRERAMPLLRYTLDDRAAVVPGACPCGSRFRRMRLTDARVEDFVQLPGGRRVYIGTFLAIGLTLPGIAEFMVRQDEAGEVTVSIVPEPAAGLAFEQVAASVQAMVNDQLGIDVPMRVVPVERVTLTAGGKARLIQSAYRPPEPPS